MIKIITIEREYGCGGAEIAQKIADRLGWKLWDQLLTCEIARLSNCDQAEVKCREERVDPLYYRLFKSILRGSFEGSLNVHRLKLLDADSILRITERVVQTAAAEAETASSSAEGRSIFLRDRDDALRDIPLRPEGRENSPPDRWGHERGRDAEEVVDTVDDERAEFIEKYFHMEWPSRSIYHAMLNTAVGDEIVIDAILSLKKAMEQKA